MTSIGPVTHIVVHYSATYADQDVTAADIDRMHKALAAETRADVRALLADVQTLKAERASGANASETTLRAIQQSLHDIKGVLARHQQGV